MIRFEALFLENKKIDVKFKDFTVNFDQYKESNGDETAPEPLDTFFATIVSCAATYAKSFCQQRDIYFLDMRIIQDITFNKEAKMTEKITLNLFVNKDFPDKYFKPIIKAMDICTVKRHLNPSIVIETLVSRL